MIKITSELIKRIESKLKIKILNYKILGNGEHNINFLLETTKSKFVLRIYANTQFENSKQEYDILKKINGKVAPKVYFFDNSRVGIEYDYMIQEFIEGKPMGKFSAKNIVRVAKLLKNVHRIKTKKYDKDWKNPISDWAKENILVKSKFLGKEFHEEMKELYQKVLERMEEIKPLAKKFKRINLIHDDPVASNFIEKKNGDLILLDWEFAHFDYFFLDFGCVIAESHLNKNIEHLLLKSYGFGIKPEENKIVQAVKVNRSLSLISWLIERIASGEKGKKMFVGENISKYKKRLKKEIKYAYSLLSKKT